MTQGLLTLGAIPAISVDTPHYPEEREKGGRGRLRGGGAGHIHTRFAACADVKRVLSL